MSNKKNTNNCGKLKYILRTREKERESVCVCVREREREGKCVWGGGGERDRQTDRQTDRQRQRQRDRHRERVAHPEYCPKGAINTWQRDSRRCEREPVTLVGSELEGNGLS